MAQPIMSLDMITDTAYRAAPKFDSRTSRASVSGDRPLQALVRSSTNVDQDYAAVGVFNPELTESVSPTSETVTMLVKSDVWLKHFGLEANHLDARSIARRLGFRHAKNFDNILRKEVSSIYGENLFCRFMQIDGKEYNITATKDELKQALTGLSKLMDIYRKRLDWLTHGSRKLFGLILERRVTVLVDFQILSVLEFEQFCLAFERLIREQLSRVDRFNVIRCDEDPLNCFSPECVPATAQNVEAAVQWLHNWRRVAIVPQVKSINTSNFTSHSVVDGFLKASNDRLTESVYLFSNGVTVECCKEILRDRVQHAHLPVHVAAFNCANASMLQYFGELCSLSGGRMHAYRVTMQFALYEALPYSEEQHSAPVGKREYVCGSSSKANYGNQTDRSNVSSTRDDVLAVFAENETAKELTKQIQTVLKVVEERELALRKNNCQPKLPPGVQNRPSAELLEYQQDEYMSSDVWLAHNGIKARRLDFYDFLKNLVFRHVDGIMDQCYSPIKSRFELAMEQSREQELGANARAESLDLSLKKRAKGAACLEHTSRLVHAQYCCELFAHIRWPTGELMHVQVSPEVYRLYEERMLICMNAIERRLSWLKRGSRAVFGTIVEDHVYLIIDTSESMLPHMQFLKDRIYLLLQEQLRHKKSMNIIVFNTEVVKWKPTLQPINENTLQEAWKFIKSLDAYGTTNTLEALRAALLDKAPTQALYLLTDGRPDAAKALVLEEIESYKFYRSNPGTPAKERAIPRMHCISFNCEDYEANLFLRDLAKLTGGRFHSFHVSEEEQRKRIASRYPLKLKKTDGVLEFSSLTQVEYENPVYDGDDIGYLEREMSLGRTQLFRLQELRDQCAAKQQKAQRNRQERVAKLDDARRQADSRRKNDTVQRRDLVARNRLVATSLSHAKMLSSMRERVNKTDDENEPPRNGQAADKDVQLAFPDWMLPETKMYLVQARTPRQQWKRRQAKERDNKRKVQEKRKRREARRAAGENEESMDSEEEAAKQIPLCPVPVSPELARKVGEEIAKERRRELEESEQEEMTREQLKKCDHVPSIRQWLRKNSLEARKLTLYDVLKPTFVTHSHKYVPILRKHIHGKVFRDILPFGYVPAASSFDVDQQNMRELSGRSDDDASQSRSRSRSRSRSMSRSKNERVIRLINPLAVDLKKYMSEVEQHIAYASALLNKCVWNALTEEQRLEVCGQPLSDQAPEPEEESEPENSSAHGVANGGKAPDAATETNEGTEKREVPVDEKSNEEAAKKPDDTEKPQENSGSSKMNKKPPNVRKVLPRNAKRTFSFPAHRNDCLRCLEENEWPVNTFDRIEQLEVEIETARKCLEQARELSAACAEELRLCKLKQAEREKERQAKREGASAKPERNKQKEKDGLKKRSERDDAQEPPKSASSSTAANYSNTKDADSKNSSTKSEAGPEFKMNQIVIARNSEDGLFYHANIRRKVDEETYEVEFTNPNLALKNRTQTMKKMYLLPVEVKEFGNPKKKKVPDSQKAESYKPGTAVLVRALNSETSEFCYVPGVVVRVIDKKAKAHKPTKSNPIRDTTQDKDEVEFLCELVLYDAQSCRARLKNLVIIKHDLYESARNHLLDRERKRKHSKSARQEKTHKRTEPRSARSPVTKQRSKSPNSSSRSRNSAREAEDKSRSDSESSVELPDPVSSSSSSSSNAS